jgi:hypothetical protein
MPLEDFENLFLRRISSLKMEIDDFDSILGSRIGGYAPSCFEEKEVIKYDLNSYWYFFTISQDILNLLIDDEISVFIPKDFNLYNKNYKYPNLPIRCISHSFSERGKNKELFNPQIKSKKIISTGVIDDMNELEDVDNPNEIIVEPILGSKIGGNPSLLQKDDSFYINLLKDGYEFLMQFDESSYLKGQITGNEPFNHGIIYFYGKFKNKLLTDFVAGFWQN